MWQYHDKKMRELSKLYNKMSKRTQNRLQEIFDGIDFEFNKLYDYASKSRKEYIDIYIEELKEKGLLKGYFGVLAKSIYRRTRVKNSEILELLIYGAYIEEQHNLEEAELKIFKEDMNYYYQQGQEEVNKTLKQPKMVSIIPDAIFLALLDMPNSKGYIYSAYIEAMIRFNAEQTFAQAIINLNQQKPLKMDSDEFKNLIKKQQKRKLNVKSDKISGDTDLTLIGLNNKAKIEGMTSFDSEAQVQFIAIHDNVTTKMCKSLDGQIFYAHNWNTFKRYSQINDTFVPYKCYGLVQGLNLPPIDDGFHWCRSTIKYIR